MTKMLVDSETLAKQIEADSDLSCEAGVKYPRTPKYRYLSYPQGCDKEEMMKILLRSDTYKLFDLGESDRLKAKIERLEDALREIATGYDKNGLKSDFPRDIAREALTDIDV